MRIIFISSPRASSQAHPSSHFCNSRSTGIERSSDRIASCSFSNLQGMPRTSQLPQLQLAPSVQSHVHLLELRQSVLERPLLVVSSPPTHHYNGCLVTLQFP